MLRDGGNGASKLTGEAALVALPPSCNPRRCCFPSGSPNHAKPAGNPARVALGARFPRAESSGVEPPATRNLVARARECPGLLVRPAAGGRICPACRCFLCPLAADAAGLPRAADAPGVRLRAPLATGPLALRSGFASFAGDDVEVFAARAALPGFVEAGASAAVSSDAADCDILGRREAAALAARASPARFAFLPRLLRPPPPCSSRAASKASASSSVIVSGDLSFGSVALTPSWLT